MTPVLTIEWKERSQHHRASLPITEQTVRTAMELVSRVLPLKSRQMYVDGDHIDPYTVKSVLAWPLAESHNPYSKRPINGVVSCEHHKTIIMTDPKKARTQLPAHDVPTPSNSTFRCFLAALCVASPRPIFCGKKYLSSF